MGTNGQVFCPLLSCSKLQRGWFSDLRFILNWYVYAQKAVRYRPAHVEALNAWTCWKVQQRILIGWIRAGTKSELNMEVLNPCNPSYCWV